MQSSSFINKTHLHQIINTTTKHIIHLPTIQQRLSITFQQYLLDNFNREHHNAIFFCVNNTPAKIYSNLRWLYINSHQTTDTAHCFIQIERNNGDARLNKTNEGRESADATPEICRRKKNQRRAQVFLRYDVSI